MGNRWFAIALLLGTFSSHSANVAAATRCSYQPIYPSAVGRSTYLLASATRDSVTASVDTANTPASRTVPAQVMRIDSVTGFQADIIRDGLRASGGTAVFIRYMTCYSAPFTDGAFDNAGVSGLYVGRPRSAAQWIDGRPTFDVFRADHFPLPQQFWGRNTIPPPIADSTPVMTSAQMFAMYRTLWAESVVVDDRTVEQRIRRWLASNSREARIQPTEQVASGMLSAITQAKVQANPIPFGGTYAITLVVPGIDSLVAFGQTSYRTRPWTSSLTRDSATGVPFAVETSGFAVDFMMSTTLAALFRPQGGIGPCAGVPIIVDRLPIAATADSTWVGEMWPSGFFQCMPVGSVLYDLLLPGVRMTPVPLGRTSVRFRRHADGRITFEARLTENGITRILVHGERLSTESYLIGLF
jgi:hypothetical protein